MSSTEHKNDQSRNWLIFFIVCFCIILSIGVFAVFSYNCNAPEPKPGGAGHSGMNLPAGFHIAGVYKSAYQA